MKKSYKFIALVLATLIFSAVFPTIAFAVQPGDNARVATDDEANVSYTVTLTVNGGGVVKVYARNGDLLETVTGGADAVTKSYTVKSNDSIFFNVEGELTKVDWNEPNRVIDRDGSYWVRASKDSYVRFYFKGSSAPETNPKPEPEKDPEVKITAGTGGTVKVNERLISSGAGTIIPIKKGEKVVFVVTPNENYEIDLFKVDGVAVELAENTYTVEAIEKNIEVIVTFKNPLLEQNAIGVNNVTDWTKPIINITDGKLVLREVFDKIKSLGLQDNKFAEFKSASGSIFVPFGGQTSGSFTSVDMAITNLSSGADYSAISENFSDNDINFKVYSFATLGVDFPVGTKVSFNLGNGFADKEVYLLVLDGNDLVVRDKDLAPAKVGSNGVSGTFTYNGENIVVLADGIPTQYTIETIINEGGTINPFGVSNAVEGESLTYVIRANEGYYISKILVNDEIFQLGENVTSQNLVLESIDKNYTIKVEFAANEINENDGNDNDGNIGTIIVILVIVLIAVSGAAVLFIVKWRQEKF